MEQSSLGESLVQWLADNVSRQGSGIDFVYHALEVGAAVRGWQDTLLSLEDPALERQFFRLAGAPVSASPLLAESIASSTGLVTEPPEGDDGVAAVLVALCTIALHLDILRHDASHDELTGLFNRRTLDNLLAQMVARSERHGWPFILVILDLDNFKSVNDEFGHETGDDLLRLVAREMRASLRTGDVAARIGGDEFALIVAGEPDVFPMLMARLRSVALHTVARDIPVGISAGFAACPRDGFDAQRLYTVADENMYQDKVR